MSYSEGSAVVEQGLAFMNPKAKFSRDATIACVSLNGPLNSVLDATSATGIRGIRYYNELAIENINFLEINEQAYKTLRSNIQSSGIKKYKAENVGFQEFCNRGLHEKFDMIDIDPFGSPAPYIFDALKISKDGTILAVTATDTAVLCGAHSPACIKSYDSVPMHNELSHETGTRILLGFIVRLAAQFNYGIKVKLAFAYAHYIRVIIELEHGSASAISSIQKMGYAYKCSNCQWHGWGMSYFPKIHACAECGSAIEISGKLWLGELIDSSIANDMKSKLFEISGIDLCEKKLMETIATEPEIPLYYSIPKLTKYLKIPSVSELEVIKALSGSGHIATRTHFEKNCLKTDASYSELKSAIISISKNPI